MILSLRLLIRIILIHWIYITPKQSYTPRSARHKTMATHVEDEWAAAERAWAEMETELDAPPQVIVEQSFNVDYNHIKGHAPLVKHRPRYTISEGEIPEPRVLTTEDHFTKYARSYHHGPRGRKWKGDCGGRNIVEQAMIEIVKNDTYIGFSHNESENSVYLLRRGVWNGIEGESIGCESRPVPQGLPQKTSSKWRWHSLYIKN